MPIQFDTKRIYELPVLRHNTEAIRLIYSNALGENLSDSFLQKAIEHNTLLAKLIILDNIPVGCLYSHIEKDDKNENELVVDYICVLKSYQRHGVGKYAMTKLFERIPKDLHVKTIAVYARTETTSNVFFEKLGFVAGEACEHSFDDKIYNGVKMTKSL